MTRTSMLALALTILIACFLCSCALVSPDDPDPPLEIVNLGPAFEKFWEAARGLPFEAQEVRWSEHVEGPHQTLFDRVVWNKGSRPDWEAHREKQLREYFGYYATHSLEIQEAFAGFDGVIQQQLRRYAEEFPGARFDLPIYGLPSAGQLNGRVGDMDGKPFLAFGIDMIVRRQDDADILYSHELFHVFHTDRIGTENWDTRARLTLPLWLEGLATHVSAVLCPGHSDARYLFDDSLSELTPESVSRLAALFLRDAEHLPWGGSPEGMEAYRRWFMPEQQVDSIPARAGYLLGLRAVRALASEHELSAMIAWQPERAHEELLRVLQEL